MSARYGYLTCTGERWLPAHVYAMSVIMVAVLTISADDMNVRLRAMLTRSRMRCSAARTADAPRHNGPLI